MPKKSETTTDAEALRYRLIVRLTLIQREAKRMGRTDAVTFADALRKEVEGASPDSINTYTSKVDDLQKKIGLPDHAMRAYPRWMSLAGYAAPVVALLAILAFIVERRRRKRALTEEQIERLDQSS